MSDGDPTGGNDRLNAVLADKVRRARRAVAFERVWPRVWLPVAVCGIFVLASAFELWAFLPPRLHQATLLAFALALAASFVPLFTWPRPSTRDALTRLEQASGIDHRPLTAVRDTLSGSGPSPDTEALWRAHKDRMAALVEQMGPGPARPPVDRHDPIALRFALILTLAATGIALYGDLGPRIMAAFRIPEVQAAGESRLDIWVTPPPYTRKDAVVLATGALALASPKEAVPVPDGSVVTIKINGGDASRFAVSWNTGTEHRDLAPGQSSGDAFREYSQKMSGSGTLTVKPPYGRERQWVLTAVQDKPPSIAFTGPIEISPRAVMLYKYRVEDDYGVVSAEARIERDPSRRPDSETAGTRAVAAGKPPVFTLSLPRGPVRNAEAKSYKDLTSHPWAGLPVIVTLAAKDEAGGEGQSTPRGFILPERKFNKPLARAVILQRSQLVENPSDAPTVGASLDALAKTGEEDGLQSQTYLGLRSVYWRLKNAAAEDDIEAVIAELWDIAVRIEDGNLPEAEKKLRAAQERLKEALENGASRDAVQKAMDELRQALDKYVEAMRDRSQNDAGRSASSKDRKSISQAELQKLLDKIENLAKAGSNDTAEQMLSELQDILESLKSAKKGTEGSEEGEDGDGQQQLDRLTDMVRKQQQLLDETFREQQKDDGSESDGGRSSQPGGTQSGKPQDGAKGQKPGAKQGKDGSSKLSERQSDIKKQLDELLSDMSAKRGDSIRKKLEDAGKSMGEAGSALGSGDMSSASEEESRALESLRQGSKGMAQQMMKSAGGTGEGGQASRDPMGRKQGGQLSDPGDNVKVPDEITIQRAREIQDELRKRLGEPSRPSLEIDYLERLIKRF